MSSPKLIQVPKKDCNRTSIFKSKIPIPLAMAPQSGYPFNVCKMHSHHPARGENWHHLYYYQVTTTKRYPSSHSWKHKQWPYMVQTIISEKRQVKIMTHYFPWKKDHSFHSFSRWDQKIYHWLSWLSMVRWPRYESLPRMEALGPEPAPKVKVHSRDSQGHGTPLH